MAEPPSDAAAAAKASNPATTGDDDPDVYEEVDDPGDMSEGAAPEAEPEVPSKPLPPADAGDADPTRTEGPVVPSTDAEVAGGDSDPELATDDGQGTPSTALPTAESVSVTPGPQVEMTRSVPAEEASQLEHREPERFGFRQGRFFIRDHRDRFRLYPGGRLRTDFQWSPGAADIGQAAGEAHFAPRLVLRRVRLELAGEIFKRIGFSLGMELGGQRIGAIEGLELEGLRLAPASAHGGEIRPAEVSVSYRFRSWLSLTVGQFNAPFSMANRTRETLTPFLERNIAIRGFAVPYEKELGMTVWGELFGKRTLAYELGVFSGDGSDHIIADDRPEFMGRIFARPLTRLGSSTFFRYAQIGMSMRHGQRDQAAVAYDYPTIASDHGFIFWRPAYLDSHGRTTHVLPSGAQNAIGGELRLPFDLPFGRGLDVRGEAYYVVNNTREAVAGYQTTNTERFGRFKGLGWYGQISYWACGDAFVSGEPGIYRPVHVDMGAEDEPRRGLEVLGGIAGINANYAGATRHGSQPDANTPHADITIYQFGLGVQYWYTRAFRAAVNYMLYWAPGTGEPTRNQAVVPDLLAPAGPSGRDELMHEIGSRLAVSF